MDTLLVIDDEPTVQSLFQHVFERRGWTVTCCDQATDGLAILDQHSPAVLALDLLLPDLHGLDVLKQVRQKHPLLPVIVMTARGSSSTAIQAIQCGAMDYLVKPLNVNDLLRLVERAAEINRLQKQAVAMTPTSPELEVAGDVMIGRSPVMQRVYKSIGRVAGHDVSVLIRGESGTGKELVARALVQYSRRSKGPFEAVNCAAIPDALLESELFGHERGAFTGADRQRLGKFELCHGGTLFLDEIGDMDRHLQSKILRVLQEKTFQRVGGNQTLHADVRVLAATHRPLERMCSLGEFREDLFYRLNGYSIWLPPLRERGDDIDLLVDYFLQQASREFGRATQSISVEARQLLARYPWPGNIRELRSVIRQACLESTGPVLIADFLPDAVRMPTTHRPSLNPNDPPLIGDAARSLASNSRVDQALAGESLQPESPVAAYVSEWVEPGSRESWELRERYHEGMTLDRLIELCAADRSSPLYDQVIDTVERRLIATVLERVRGNQTEAARLLGITRTTLRAKIHKHRIGIRRVVEPEE